MTRTSDASGPVLRSLRHRNYRRFLAGHGLSNVGMWTQQTAELWLILELTGSGAALGVHSIMRFGPVLFFGLYGGLLGDRFDRLRLLVRTQSAQALGAGVIATAAWLGSPSLLLIYAIVLTQGLVNAVDNPLRRGFVRDLVPEEDLSNAVSLSVSVGTVSRAMGPALAGVIIASAGVKWAFTINALSYGAVLAVLLTLDRQQMRPQQVATRAPRQVRAGFRYAWGNATIRRSLLLCLFVSTFGWNFAVIVPFYVTEELGGGPSLYGALLSLMSLGSFAGAMTTARLHEVSARYLLGVAGALALALALATAAPTLPVAIAGLILIGVTGTSVIVGSQSRIQLAVSDAMSGRVLAIYSVVFVGSKPFGGMIGGWLIDLGGARTAFGVGAVAIAVAVVALRATRAGEDGATSDPGKPSDDLSRSAATAVADGS